MKIGVDFDNTIVCYDKVFHLVALEKGLIYKNTPSFKDAVRDHLRNLDNEQVWTELQGLIYGTRMSDADPFPGVFNFFEYCKSRGIEVFIVSHKTLHPYLGPKYNLHESARNWLELQGLFDPKGLNFGKENVFFELTKEEKMNRIDKLGCEFFIDDLPEFLSESKFPKSVDRILFDPNNNHKDKYPFPKMKSWQEVFKKFENV